jgi:hypothetical protein
MGLLLAEGKTLKHLEEKPHHKIPYHDLSFLWRRTPQHTLRTQRNLKLLVQPYDADDYYYCLFPSNGAPVE